MKRLALRGALTAKFGDEAIKVIDTFGLEAIKTKDLVGVLARAPGDRPGPRRRAGARREARAVGAQPADGRGDPRRLAQRRRPAQRRRRPHRAAALAWRRMQEVLRMSVLTAPEIILRPVISEKSIDESGRGKYTFAVHDEANKIQIKAAVEELYKKENVTVVVGQRPDHQGQGEAPRHAPRAGSSATPRPGARPSSPWPPARRSNSSRGSDDAASQLQGHLAGAPADDSLDLRGDHHQGAVQAAARAADPRLRPQQPGPPHRPPSRRRREAALPQDRLQARQARRAGPSRDDRVRPEPLGADRPAPLPRRREALHAPARTA